MKVALVRPRYHTHLITPPIGIGYLASYLRTNGHNVILVDGLNKNIDNKQIESLVRDCDIIGITAQSDFFDKVIEIASILKKTDKVVVLGGPHPTFLPKESFRDTQADFIVSGEGELTMLELLNCIENKGDLYDIKGLYINGALDNFKERPLIENLDKLPFPAWDLLDPRYYKRAPHGGLVKNFPIAPMMSSRGCPYNCSFCSIGNFWKRRVRSRSSLSVADEIEMLTKDFGVKEIHFEDANIAHERKHIVGIAEEIIRRNIKISWATPNGVRADDLDEELIVLMKKSGCYALAFGIESASQHVLDKTEKHMDLGIVEKAIRMANKHNIITQGFFIFGLPGETEESALETIRFAKRLPLDKAQFLLLDIIPGTTLWHEHKDELVNRKLWQKRSFQELSWVPPTMSTSFLRDIQAKAFRSFFLRPDKLMFILRLMKPEQIRYIIRRVMDFKVFKK